MGKHDAAPTYGWVFTSQVHRRMSQIFIIVIIFLAAFAFVVYGKLSADCAAPASYDLSLFKYELNFTASTKPDECITNY